ncbi:GNAT family N-acetyltransferase [Robiginitalea aurantiaca]|uniref:GNAT family N-acetyltransferase n=1 Tax=Robiginitalea aurantiaca TaxID=3056915 RepID=A0ABT7WI27_9FLAO|nr:GNAT family N-acetyltransferase [Robiginitalea aurantiaca]MDM9632560.1 GNAT family N-acetyltransferase [Robiginitalea aurantiaca]
MLELKFFPISVEEDIWRYKSLLSQIDPYNPYSRYELIDLESSRDNKSLNYFLLTSKGLPIVLMPFYLEKIHIENEPTAYFDVTTPWGYMGPIVKPENISILESFWKKADEWYRSNNVISEFVRFSFNGNQMGYSGTIAHTLSNIRGRLLSTEELWGGFKRSVRKNYNTAIRNQLVYRIYHKNIPVEKIEDFYSIWKGTMDRLEAAPSYYHSLDYFSNYICNNEDCCALAIVENPDGVAISTELLLFNEDTMFSFLGGTDAKYFASRPNDLLKIESMKWAREQGLKYYMLGGGLSDGDTLYQYKKKFFPEEPEVIFYTGRKIVNPEVYGEISLLSGFGYSEPFIQNDLSNRFFPKYRSQKVSL